MKQFKIVVEKHPDTYVAYPLGLKGVVVGQGDTYEAALADVPCALVGEVTDTGKLEVVGLAQPIPETDSDATEVGTPIVVEAEIGDLKEVWQKPLDW